MSTSVILIADDDPSIRALLTEALESPGRTLVVTDGGRAALAAAATLSALDVVVVDKNMPDMDGLELVHRLRKGHEHTEYLMLTGYPSLDSAAEAVRLGLCDYLCKPSDISTIEAAVVRAEARALHSREAVTRQRAIEERLASLATHDSLTGLPNRGWIEQRIEAAVRALPDTVDEGLAVLALDLDGFDRVIDTAGHKAGDEVLIEWARRVGRLLNHNESLARLAGDQFAILAPALSNAAGVALLVARVQTALVEPVQAAGTSFRLTASVGSVLAGPRYQRGQEVLRDACTALMRAKRRGTGASLLFATGMRTDAVDTFALDQELHHALHHGELISYFQPILSLESGLVVALESLARWQHPSRGILAPAAFLERAAATGLLAELSWQVLDRACVQLKAWNERFGASFHVGLSVNISPPLLMRHGFVEEIERLIDRVGLQPEQLKLEITETVALDNTAASAEVIQALRRLGLIVCLDDFGTGYASLSWLHQFPVDELKIDRSFVEHIVDDRRSQILVGAAVNLAHSLGLPVVAEGVENRAQLEELRALSCEYAQGYLFSPPLSAVDTEALLGREAGGVATLLRPQE